MWTVWKRVYGGQLEGTSGECSSVPFSWHSGFLTANLKPLSRGKPPCLSEARLIREKRCAVDYYILWLCGLNACRDAALHDIRQL
jgi:hypothetical protein